VSEIQWFLVVVGLCVAAVGALVIWKRKPFSAEARRYREEMGMHVGPHTQTPVMAAVVGTFFAGTGLFVSIGSALGIVGA
jgi:uncharacterized membrane protein